MPILNYTTSIAAHRSVAEVQKLLALKGARSISIDYDKDQSISNISFAIEISGKLIHFRLPSNWRGVQKVLKRQTKAKKYHTDQHAQNCCWRIILEWVQAQMAIIEAEQADMATVFFPYLLIKSKNTVYEQFLKSLAEGDSIFLLDSPK